ncbi:MAG: cobalamin-binding protein [Firmicutes bacterium]|nr:cobalamin-binding protein [Bacillota bacterium]
MNKIRASIKEFTHALLQINRTEAARILNRCYKSENDFCQLEQIIRESLDHIGTGWEKGIFSLAQVYMSGVICEQLVDSYLPQAAVGPKTAPKIAIGVLEDYHSLGKRIVSSVLRAAGYELLDFGSGLSPEKIVTKTIEHQVDLLLISTLMLPSALKVAEVKQKLQHAGEKIKIIVGGAPFRLDPQLGQRVGADAAGSTAFDAVSLIEKVYKT